MNLAHDNTVPTEPCAVAAETTMAFMARQHGGDANSKRIQDALLKQFCWLMSRLAHSREDEPARARLVCKLSSVLVPATITKRLGDALVTDPSIFKRTTLPEKETVPASQESQSVPKSLPVTPAESTWEAVLQNIDAEVTRKTDYQIRRMKVLLAVAFFAVLLDVSYYVPPVVISKWANLEPIAWLLTTLMFIASSGLSVLGYRFNKNRFSRLLGTKVRRLLHRRILRSCSLIEIQNAVKQLKTDKSTS